MYLMRAAVSQKKIHFFCRIVGEPRTAVLHKGKKGFGFVLRGAKAASPLMEMIPSEKCPGLQYMDDVDPGGVADMSGILKGDFLLEVSLFAREHCICVPWRSKASFFGKLG